MQVRDIAEEIDLRFVGLGSDPVSRPGDVPYIPKRRYHIVDRYHTSSSRDGIGREFMLSTTSTQVRAAAEQTPEQTGCCHGALHVCHMRLNASCIKTGQCIVVYHLTTTTSWPVYLLSGFACASVLCPQGLTKCVHR